MVDNLFRYKSKVFKGLFKDLSAEILLANLQQYKQESNDKRRGVI